ncbi:MAG: carbohydrate ABC transporter permease [Treponema sp.]|uniref:carbohydrate ABC transporter permease n=1 Tax=Treponema sp. TaxID=166 RepID=UPI001B4D2FC0|nr:carbohydrate ABC transporter permease [Treponema sp.]MBP3772628.1 carbohydrate ABC transporter permease [Treponema sp.]MBQ9280662.1 carbohydrate ABC transporter permease [Treponema sp.]
MEKPKTVKLTSGDRAFYIGVNTFLIFIGIVIAVPIISTISSSVTPNGYIGTTFDKFILMPWKWDGAAYKALLGNNGFTLAFWNSIKIMLFGVVTSLSLTVPMAYCMSVQDLPGRKILNYFVLIPYLFNIGVIPTFLVVTNLHLTNHLCSIFLPGAIGTYNCLIMRGFFEGIPESLKESARIDGAAEWYVLISIILPLSKPIIMTIGLYYAVGYWNDFMHALLYLTEAYLQPLPILTRNILLGASMSETLDTGTAFGAASIASIKAACVFLSAIPMMLAYPFIQKYFTKGTMLGSVKG